MKAVKHLIAGLILMMLATPAFSEDVQLVQSSGVYMVPVRINDAVVIPFVLDSGAAEVVIPADVFSVLLRSGTISQIDFKGAGQYTIADGSTVSSDRYVLHKVTVGDHIITDVIANVSSAKSDPLLGQSFLQRLPAWKLDNSRHALVLNDEGTTGEPKTATVPSAPRAVPVPAKPSTTLQDVFTMLDVQVPFLESRVGVARRVSNMADEQRRTYTIDGCDVTAHVKNNNVIGYGLFFGLNDPAKQHCNIQIPGGDHLQTHNLTLGQFINTMGVGLADPGKLFRGSCIPFPSSCGNSADPAVHLRWVAPHAAGFMEIYLTAEAEWQELDRWQNLMIKGDGSNYVNSKQFDCDGKYQQLGLQMFPDSKIYEIVIRLGGQPVEPFFAKLCGRR